MNKFYHEGTAIALLMKAAEDGAFREAFYHAVILKRGWEKEMQNAIVELMLKHEKDFSA